MPADYNTRLRTNSQILPPRRLRQDESLSQSSVYRHGKPSSLSPTTPPTSASLSPQYLPQFPSLKVQLHPEDATNKTFLAIGRALFSVENRAVTIKDLSYLTMKHGLACQNASAASQAITTFIRNHLNRCRQDHSMPLLLSVPLTGTDADDRLVPALHSRSGGNPASLKPSNSALTNFRRGTTVWYLSEVAGAVCPFKQAGLSLDDIISPALQNGTKRKRESQSAAAQPRKSHVNSLPSSPSSASSTIHLEEGRQFLPRIKLTLKLPSSSISNCRPLSPSDYSESSSETDAEDNESLGESDPESPTLSTASLSSRDDSDDCYDSSDAESPVRGVHDEFQVISPSNSELYPNSSPIPSSSSSVACNDPYSFYFPQNLCPTRLIKSTLTSFLSRDSRAVSTSPSQSAASPPPDSEDEDDDFHNSMVGLRRDSIPVSQNRLEDDSEMPKFEPISPKFVPGSVHLTRKTPDFEITFEPKEVSSSPFDSASTPLETLPGFVLDSEPTTSRVTIKEEEPTITLPLSADPYFSSIESKLDCFQREPSMSSGSVDDPIQVDLVHDVEILGPETVRSREWDMAWNEQVFNGLSTDHPLSAQENGEEEQGNFPVGHESLILTPPFSCKTAILPSGVHPPTVMTSTLSCSPPIMVVTVDDVWLYCTMLGPDAPLVRRADDDMVDITQLHRFLQIPFESLSIGSSSPCFDASRANGLLGETWVPLDIARDIVVRLHDRLPADILNLFLSPELGRHFPNFIGIPVQDRASSITTDVPMQIIDGECSEQDKLSEEESSTSPSKDVCIRVEDLFGTDYMDITKMHEREAKPKFWIARSESARSSRPVSTCPDLPQATNALLGSWEQNVAFLNEQEEELFDSFVDLENGTTSCLLGQLQNHAPTSLTSLVSSPTSSCTKSNDTTVVNVMNEKENSTSPLENKGRRSRTVPTRPVRRSTRVASKAVNHPLLTRSRRKTK